MRVRRPCRLSPVIGAIIVVCASSFQLHSTSPMSSRRRQMTLSSNKPTPQDFLRDATTRMSVPANHDAANTTTASSLSQIVSLVGSTTSIVVSGLFFFALAYRRDALMLTFFMGAILNGILSKVLKKAVNQSRPAALTSELHSDGGMPSSHAMSCAFIGLFTTLQVQQPLVTLAITLYTSISLYYRVANHYHTWPQIIVGVIIGSLNGLLWWTVILEQLQSWVAENILSNGLLPLPWLAVPALIGLSVVGSFERRIKLFLKERKVLQ